MYVPTPVSPLGKLNVLLEYMPLSLYPTALFISCAYDLLKIPATTQNPYIILLEFVYVAGLLSLNNNSFFRVRGDLASADSATDTGLYSYTGGTAINGSPYGLLLNICNIQFSVSWAWGAQIFFGDNNTISFRTSIRKNGVWGAWIAIG